MNIRSRLLILPSLLIPLFLLSCTDAPTDGGDDDDPTGTTGEGLVPDGTQYTVDIEWDYDDPRINDRTDQMRVTVSDSPSDFAGRTGVLHYQVPAGFVTDHIFRGSVVEESNGDLSLYYSGNMSGDTDFWWTRGWTKYPIVGSSTSITLHDSTNASGTRRQRITWSAESAGTEQVTVKGKSYTATVIFWDMEATRWINGTIDKVVLFEGEDLWVSELAYPAERWVDVEVDGAYWVTTTSTLVDHTVAE